jgi:HlyD family secretion protein
MQNMKAQMMHSKVARLVYVAGTALIGAALLASCAPPGANVNNTQQRTATLENGTLTATVSATGNIEPEAEVRLSFQQAGTIAEVFFDESDAVKKGDVIARLDTTDLELALAQAQASLEQAKSTLDQAETTVENAKAQEVIANANYSRTLQASRPSEVTAAKAALDAAQASLDKLMAGPTTEDLASVEASLKNAEAAVKQAQSAYDRAYTRNPAGIGASPEALQLEQATNNYLSAKAQYDKVALGADAAQIKAAEQQVQSARAGYDKVARPARQFDIDQAEAQRQQALLQVRNAQTQVASARNQIKLAEIQLQQAQRKLDQASLKSPIDGVISTLNVKAGETAGAAVQQPAAIVVDTSKYHIDITVDEIDIAKVKEGQNVVVTLDSLPGVEVQGKVLRISPTSSTINGVVSYPVRVDVISSDAPMRSGMTANASIVLDKRENVLLAPNWAVRRDRDSGKTYLSLQGNNQTINEVEVKTGLRNDTFSEIVSGAKSGDVVVAPQTPNAFGQ